MGKILHPRYFPFCYGPEIRGQGLSPEIFPDRWTAITTSLANAMGLYWRVRAYTVTGQIFNVIDQVQVPFSIVFSSAATTEEDLVCYRGFYRTGGGEDLDDATFLIYPDYLHPIGQTIPVYGDSQTVSLFVDCTISQSEESSNFRSIYSPPCPGAPEPQRSAHTFSAFGQNMEVLLYARAPCNPEWAPGVNELSIEATSYWSYGGTYDTATGLPL